jgi:hypothetical protein
MQERPEVEDRDDQRACCFLSYHALGSGERVEERHFTKHLSTAQSRQLALGAVHLPLPDQYAPPDNQIEAYAGLALLHNHCSGRVFALDRSLRHGAQLTPVELSEQWYMSQELYALLLRDGLTCYSPGALSTLARSSIGHSVTHLSYGLVWFSVHLLFRSLAFRLAVSPLEMTARDNRVVVRGGLWNGGLLRLG